MRCLSELSSCAGSYSIRPGLWAEQSRFPKPPFLRDSASLSLPLLSHRGLGGGVVVLEPAGLLLGGEGLSLSLSSSPPPFLSLSLQGVTADDDDSERERLRRAREEDGSGAGRARHILAYVRTAELEWRHMNGRSEDGRGNGNVVVPAELVPKTVFDCRTGYRLHRLSINKRK